MVSLCTFERVRPVNDLLASAPCTFDPYDAYSRTVCPCSIAGNQVKAELEMVMPPAMELSVTEIGAFGLICIDPCFAQPLWLRIRADVARRRIL